MCLDQPDAAGMYPLVRIVPMVGHPVEENPLDLLFNHFLQREGAPYVQVKLNIERPEDLRSCLEGARRMGFECFGFTVPYKIHAVALCDEIKPGSQGIGAINLITFVGPERRAVGQNTDGEAISKAIRQKYEVAGQRFVLLGSGGAARGIGAQLAKDEAASITVAARNPDRGADVAGMLTKFGGEGFRSEYLPWEGALVMPAGTDVVINATSVGAFPEEEELNLAWDSMDGVAMAVDVITGPRTTPFVRQAHERGMLTADGVVMLVHIVHGGLAGLGVDVSYTDVEAYTNELVGLPLGG